MRTKLLALGLLLVFHSLSAMAERTQKNVILKVHSLINAMNPQTGKKGYFAEPEKHLVTAVHFIDNDRTLFLNTGGNEPGLSGPPIRLRFPSAQQALAFKTTIETVPAQQCVEFNLRDDDIWKLGRNELARLSAESMSAPEPCR